MCVHVCVCMCVCVCVCVILLCRVKTAYSPDQKLVSTLEAKEPSVGSGPLDGVIAVSSYVCT